MRNASIFKEYIWLVNLLRTNGRLTFSEISDAWRQSGLSEGAPLARTTFNRHRDAVGELFGIDIECSRGAGSEYYISNPEVLGEESVQNWMLSAISVNNLVSECQSIRSRILLEPIPSAGESLRVCVEAMKAGRCIDITYRRYGKSPKQYHVEPYCIKLFRQRWYLLAHIPTNSERPFTIFSFDRMLDVAVSNQTFKMPSDFSAESFFADYFGVMIAPDIPLTRVVLRCYGNMPYYLRDLPLHSSQREVRSTSEYSDFELLLRPTSDFEAALLSKGKWVEVTEPEWLADKLDSLTQERDSSAEGK